MSTLRLALIALILLHRCRLLPRIFVSGCLAAPGSSFILAQGPLTPPGAPAPTMKTLQQVEPHTPISSLPFTITQPGSYDLSGNLSGASAITISTSGVTLDLMGFELVGGSGSGISVPGTRTNLTIRNGAVRNWSGLGIAAATASNSVFRDLLISDNNDTGLLAGTNSLVSDCLARNNIFGISDSQSLRFKHGGWHPRDRRREPHR